MMNDEFKALVLNSSFIISFLPSELSHACVVCQSLCGDRERSSRKGFCDIQHPKPGGARLKRLSS
jgi:hypothetical protein